MAKKNIGSEILSQFVGAQYVQAGVTGANATAVTGATIDRQGYESAVFNLPYSASLTTAKTLKVAVEYQQSALGTIFETATSIVTQELLGTGNGTVTGVYKYDIDLSEMKRYVRFNFTPTLSNTGTDTAIVAGELILGGADKVPKA